MSIWPRMSVALRWTVPLLVVLPAQAYAIPSPELIVSSLSSVSQLWGLAGAVAGGGALAMGVRGKQSAASEKRLRRWLMAVIALATGALVLDAMQFVNARREHTARLEAALIRPTPKRADGQSLDPLLREMPYAAQASSAAGLSTDQTAILMAEIAAGKRPDVIALDIRETAETEQGGMAGARAVRFPDLATSGIDFTGKTAMLFCHNGNRSAETCAKLKSMGIDCGFMVGGFEKWLVEGRSLSGAGARTLADLRAIAPYPNQSTLLDTETVKSLIKAERAILVDVRYPGEFEGGHLPGAINLPIRPMPTVELSQRLSELPDGPVIAPCYDRRSCFYGDVLGLELTRRGRDFRGRYTLPWEYFEAPMPPPHVAAWLQAASVTPYGHAAAKLSDGLEWAAKHLGVTGAILALAALARTLVWPLAAKADRDQRIARAIAPELTVLKAQLAGDPQRQARALRHLMARNEMTPARNLLALLFLPVLALSIEAVTRLALHHGGQRLAPLAWIGDMSVPDPTLALPFAFGVLLAGYLHASLAATNRQRLIVWLVAAPMLTALGAIMPAAANLYMVASAALLLVQRWISTWRWRFVKQAMRRVRLAWVRFRMGDRQLVPLFDVAGVAGCGNKAARLAVLADIGVRVPRGVVLTGDFLQGFRWGNARWRKRRLNRIWRQVGAKQVAVRSSAAAEDGAEQSFAGVFETVLNVDRLGLEAAIEKVAVSFRASRAGAYAGDAGEANILVQPMVAARFAGVVFTQDPGVPGCALIEWVAGQGEALVSGQATPKPVRVGRLTGACESADPLPFDVRPLWALARRIEARFGRPQDIEWAHDGRRFVILQSRDIVTPPAGQQTRIGDEWQRLAELARNSGPGPVLSLDTMSELLPRPTPASLSLLNAFWASGGSMDRAARSLGFDAPLFDGDSPGAQPLYVTAFGTLYADEREKAVRALRLNAGAAKRLRVSAHKMERDMRANILPEISARAAIAEALDPARLTTGALMVLFDETYMRLTGETHVAVDRVNIAAQMFMDEAMAALAGHGQAAADALAHIPPTALRRGFARLPGFADVERWQALYALLGHRAVFDYELAAPRYGEAPETLMTAAEQLAGSAGSPPHSADLRTLPKAVRHAVKRAQRFVTLKEDAKHESLREVAHLRRLMGEVDRRFELGGTVFFLTLDEIKQLSRSTRAALFALAGERHAQFEAFKSAPQLPATLSCREIELGPLLAGRRLDNGAAASGVMRSTRVSGQAAVEGRAICVAREVCESGSPIPGFEMGDIIVARSMHPAWLPQMMQCGGVLVETGGWLSHMAILARERGLAMSVGASGLDQITTGMWLRLEADGGVVCL